MENNYYTPAIEDIRVGYECEWQSRPPFDSWESCKFISGASLPHEISLKYYRTPYLTKEQIEAEGWIDQNDRGMSENYGSLMKKGKFSLQYWIPYPRLRIQHENLGVVLETDIMKTFSINEFRFIQKLLGIS